MFDSITAFVESTGYLGIALLMFIENIFPPIPSELIMPIAGFAAARGEMNLLLAILAGSLGSLAGTSLWYLAGRWLGADRLKRWARRYGRWMTVQPRDVDKACRWFNRHSGKAVFIGRLVPAVRTLISVPAGIASMSVRRFLLYSGLGTLVWTSFLAGVGYWLGDQYRLIVAWTNPVSNAVIVLLIGWYLYRVVTFKKHS